MLAHDYLMRCLNKKAPVPYTISLYANHPSWHIPLIFGLAYVICSFTDDLTIAKFFVAEKIVRIEFPSRN
ncbi:hypothetical protein ND2E_2131 [Colwellia psychrerythraea]|uniref:Uncharacterized protein n=1 Tax=Colwellia psychrerythraea TaxID=28229 RepID=A0A099KVH4_COLPS|nr:hypothetical protein ND2E_2131 [Colwellia psychrerythraea]